MSGPFGSSQWMYSSGADFYSHSIDQSARFDGGSSSVLSRTPSSTGNRRTWTWSGWVKRSVLGTSQNFYTLFSAGPYTGSSTHLGFYYSGSKIDIISFYQYTSGYQIFYETNAVFRDPSAWYHFVVEVDTTNSTSTDRVKIYLNGEQITSFQTSTAPSLNLDTYLNLSGTTHYVGSSSRASTDNLEGYLAEVNFIDGTALDADSFGETKAGIWIPKDTSGLTFGTNGYRLKFQDSSALGDDTSGNGNDFTASGLAATDVVLDSPTNNWSTMNPLNGDGGTTWKEGALELSTANKGNNANTFFMESGKWYWEAIGTYPGYVGAVCAFDRGTYNNTISISGSDSIGYYSTGTVYWGTGTNTTPASYSATDIIGVAVNMDDGEISFYKNNSLEVTLTFSSTISRLATEGCYACYNNGSTSTTKEFNVNFGQDSSFAGNKTAQGNTDDNGNGDFYYSPPSGFLALCSANLPNPGIDPAQDEEPADYFNTVLFTGNGSTQSITGVGFQPDWVWIKMRSDGSRGHALFDVVRGGTERIDSAYSQEGRTNEGNISFDSDGFSVTSSHPTVNDSSDTVVAWNWLAGGSAASNTDGTITSSVSANTEAGFSIVGYTGTGSAGTVGHGLSQAPELVIWKDRDTAVNWLVQGDVMGAAASGYIMLLNTTGSSYANSNFNTTLGASTITLDAGGTNYNGSGKDTIAYCFHSVDGYSRVGTYSGNGSTDGPFVYTGHRVAWVMIKRTDSSGSWRIYDNKRVGYNVVDDSMQANSTSAEDTNNSYNSLDFVSNGFKLRGNSGGDTNDSGATYIYLCFAEQPFKYSNAR